MMERRPAGNPFGKAPALGLVVAVATLLVSQNAYGYDAPAISVRQLSPGSRVSALASDQNGFMWFATERGLMRYDGRSMVPAASGQTSFAQVVALQPDDEGGVWCGGKGPTPLRYVHASGAVDVVPLESSVTSVLALAYAHKTLWIGTNSGLFKRNGAQLERVESGLGANTLINAILVMDPSTFWLGHANGLTKVEKGKFMHVPNAAGIPALAADRDGHIWAGHAEGLRGFVYDNSGRLLFDFHSSPIHAFLAESDGTMWIATERGLLKTIGSSAPEEVDLGPDLDHWDQRLRAVQRDRDGTLWVGTAAAGALQVDTDPMIRVIAPDPLRYDSFGFSVAVDVEKAIWLSTTTSLLRLNNDSTEAFPHGPSSGLPYDTRALSAARQGGVWAASVSSGSFVLNPQRAKHFLQWDERGVRAIYDDLNRTVWFGWAGGNLGRSINGQAAHIVELPNAAVVTSIVPSKRGGLWLGTENDGVLRLHPSDEINRYHRGNGLNSDNVLFIVELPDSSVCAGTATGGIDCLRDGRFVHYGAKEGLTDEPVGAAVADSSGGIWLGTTGGVVYLKLPESGQHRITSRTFGSGSGLRSVECVHGLGQSAVVRDDGTILFVTTRGLVWVDPRKLARQVAPPVFIYRLLLNGRNQDAPHPTWSVGNGNVEISYAAPRYRGADALSFFYRLEGQDRDWINAEGRQMAMYTNLDAGDYTFKVMVQDGDTRAFAKRSFRLEAPFHRSRAFFAILGLGFLAILAGGFRINTFVRRTRRADVIAERTRLARELHDTVEQNVVAVRIQLDGALESLSGNDSLTKQAHQHLETAVDLLGHTSKVMRTAIYALRSNDSRIPDLAMAISASAGRLLRGSKVSFKIEMDPSDIRVSGIQHQHILAILEEALFNSIKHSGAEHVGVTGKQKGSSLTIEVRDDGHGRSREADEAGRHFGIVGMKERAQLLGGMLAAEPLPSGGFVVRLVLPVDGNPRSASGVG